MSFRHLFFCFAVFLFLVPSKTGDLFYLLDLEREVKEVLSLNYEEFKNDFFIERLINDSEPVDFPNNSQIKYFAGGEFHVLDKINSCIKKFILESGNEICLGNLQIQYIISIADAYAKQWMLFKVQELMIDQDPKILFFGWIALDDLSANSFVHYRYEILPIKCLEFEDLSSSY